MLHGHESVAKKLLRAFSASKTAPRRSKAIAALAAAALASGIRQNGEADPAAIPNPDGNNAPGGGGAGGEAKEGGDTLVAAASGENFGLDGGITIVVAGVGVDASTGSPSGVGETPVGGEGSDGVAAASGAGNPVGLDGAGLQAPSCAGGGNSDGDGAPDARGRKASVVGRRASEAGFAVRNCGIVHFVSAYFYLAR